MTRALVEFLGPDGESYSPPKILTISDLGVNNVFDKSEVLAFRIRHRKYEEMVEVFKIDPETNVDIQVMALVGDGQIKYVDLPGPRKLMVSHYPVVVLR